MRDHWTIRYVCNSCGASVTRQADSEAEVEAWLRREQADPRMIPLHRCSEDRRGVLEPVRIERLPPQEKT